MTRWAAAPMDRTQMTMFSPTLDSMIPDDHPVRLFDEILGQLDWSAWEAHYVLVHGQPPIHPRTIASLLLYGLSSGLRASRRLEWACANAVDFMWLAQGRQIDHSTFCQFRTRFGGELKGVFRQLGHVAMGMGLVRLNQIALDGTRIKANSSRHGAASGRTIELRLAELDAQIAKALQEAQEADHRDGELFGEGAGPNHLPRELADLKRRQERLAKALDKARREQAQKDDGGQDKKVKVPLADPDAAIFPNKEGGFAPNYTPFVAVDTASGIIVAADVLADSDETGAVLPALGQVQDDLGKPQSLLADAGFNSGPNLQALQEQQIEAYMPSATRRDAADNPARREDLTKPVGAEDWDKLPLDKSTKRLGRTAFIYDSAQDRYICPMGKTLPFQRIIDKQRRKGPMEYRRYRCGQCEGCPLRERCLTKKSDGRTIDRDRYEELRESMDVRLCSASGQAAYRQRAPWVEGAFGVIKSTLGLRQFLLRGLEKVKTEWRWTCSAFNLRKIAAALARRKTQMMAMTIQTA